MDDDRSFSVVNWIRCRNYHPRGIVHAGAQFAKQATAYLELEPDLIVWIEADPDKTAYLTEVLRSSSHLATRQIAIQAVITGKDGPVLFRRYSNQGASSSIFKISNEYNEATFQEHGFLLEQTAMLSLFGSRLDNCLLRAGVRPEEIDVLVLDLQGAELLALQSAGNYLEHIRFLQIEVSTRIVYEGGARFDDIHDLLAKLDFELISPDPHQRGHCDAVYERRCLGKQPDRPEEGSP